MSRSFSDFDSLTNLLAGTAAVAAIVISQPTAALAKPAQEVAQIAQMTTVQINNSLDNPGGSGAIIAKQGNTYTILTANHVVLYSDAQYSIVTHKQKQYRATKVQRLQASKDAPDLALVTFESPEDYAVASLANSDQAVIGADIYVCGYPLPSLGAGKQREFTLSTGIVSARPESRPQGYTLRYNATTRVGMSGGPIFDIEGRVVGIHGQADIDDSVAGDSGATVAIKTGFNAGIPINTFMALKSQIGLSGVDLAVDNTPTSNNPTARLSNPQTAKDYYAKGLARFEQDDFQGATENSTQALRLDPNFSDAYLLRGIVRFKQEDYQGGMEDFNQALRINPDNSDNYVFYSIRAFFRFKQEDYQGAIEDSNQALRINPNYAQAYFFQGFFRFEQKDYQRAIEAFNQVLRINPDYAEAYVARGKIRFEQNDYRRAMEDYNQALRINPKYAAAYGNRAAVRLKQEDYQRALEDANQALRLDPKYADAYFLQGVLRYRQGDKQGGLEDLQKAATLYLQQGKTESYQSALNVIKKLQQ